MERSWKIAKEKKLRPKKEELSSTAAFNGQSRGADLGSQSSFIIVSIDFKSSIKIERRGGGSLSAVTQSPIT